MEMVQVRLSAICAVGYDQQRDGFWARAQLWLLRCSAPCLRGADERVIQGCLLQWSYQRSVPVLLNVGLSGEWKVMVARCTTTP